MRCERDVREQIRFKEIFKISAFFFFVFFSSLAFHFPLIEMVNLTTYRPRTISLGREIPKTVRQLIEHERNYREFLRKRIKTIRTSKNDRRVPFDLHSEEISHFRLRQIRWKNQVERENHRLICSLM